MAKVNDTALSDWFPFGAVDSYDYSWPLDHVHNEPFVPAASDEAVVSEAPKPTVPLGEEFENDDAAWILSCTFLIFTMQTGFALVESGMCSMKNEVNILMKNVVDVGCSGFFFWAFGFGLIYGQDESSTSLYGIGHFFFGPDVTKHGHGELYLRFFLSIVFASTSITITSGGMAERTNFVAFILFSVLSMFCYCLPARWVWGPTGWMQNLAVFDAAGSSVVHLRGGIAALISAFYLGPRIGIHHQREKYVMGSPKNALTGLFMIWWAYLAFNACSVFGISQKLWMLASKATVTTMVSSFGSSSVGLLSCYLVHRRKIHVPTVLNCSFSGLVAITGCCYAVSTVDALIIGTIGGCLTVLVMLILQRIQWLDDPCGFFAIHGVNGAWGTLATGLFANVVPKLNNYAGLFKQGGMYLLSVQALLVLVISLWTIVTTYVSLKLTELLIPLRMSTVNELLGADYSEHNILHSGIGIEEAVRVLTSFYDDIATNIQPTGNNIGHTMYLDRHFGSANSDKVHPWSEQTTTERLQRATNRLSIILGEEVTIQDVTRLISQARPPRTAEGGGAFFSRNIFS